MANKKLYRSESDRIIAGVCGGLGDYFDIDPVIVRIVFLVLFFGAGSGLIPYIVLWLVIPTESAVKGASQKTKKAKTTDAKVVDKKEKSQK